MQWNSKSYFNDEISRRKYELSTNKSSIPKTENYLNIVLLLDPFNIIKLIKRVLLTIYKIMNSFNKSLYCIIIDCHLNK